MQKLTLKNIITQNCLPGGGTGERGRAPAGTVYFCRDTANAFIAMADGCLLNLTELVNGTVPCVHVPVPGPQGQAGRDAAPARDGIDGKNGIDGAPGPKGDRGDVLIPKESELQQAVIALRLKVAKFQAAVLHAYERNTGRTHSGLKAAVDAAIQSIERNAK